MEIVIDEHAIRLLRRGSFSDDEMRLIVAALKITNDLERIGDIAVNVAERVISLRELPGDRVARRACAHGCRGARDGEQEPGRADFSQRRYGDAGLWKVTTSSINIATASSTACCKA